LLARKLCCCWHEAHKQAAWAVRQLVLASTYKLVGLQLMQPQRFTQPKQNGWSLHGRDAAAVQLMGCLLQLSLLPWPWCNGGNLLARKRCFCWHQAHKQAAWAARRSLQPARERSGRARASNAKTWEVTCLRGLASYTSHIALAVCEQQVRHGGLVPTAAQISFIQAAIAAACRGKGRATDAERNGKEHAAVTSRC